VGGERLYRRARRGERLETPEREVEVYRAELVGSGEGRADFEIECSAGTYVRSLIETLEDAYCETLRRVAIGPFSVDAAGGEPLSVEVAMSFLPERSLDEPTAVAVTHGRRVAADPPPERGAAFRLTHAGRLVAIGRADGAGIKPEVVL